MSGLLPLLFALAILDTSRPHDASAEPLPWLTWALVFAGSVATWLALGEGVGRALARVRDRRWLERWDAVAHALMLGWLAWICYGLGWTTRVETYTASIMPWLAVQVAHWWTLSAALRPLVGRARSRHDLIAHQLRFGMLPMLAILPAFDLCNWISIETGVQGWFLRNLGQHLTIAVGSLLLGIGALVLLPVFLVRMWRAQPLPPGPLADDLLAACARLGVGVRRIMLWPSEGAKVYNAAVIGVHARVRYVLFTQDLLDEFPPPQVVAVLGHELGHARHRHLVLYLLFALATLLASFLLADPVTRLLALIPGAEAVDPRLQEGAATLALLALKWRLVFGYLSRACERQADLAGAELCGDPRVMREALRSVARLSGHPEDAPSWRHYSIAERAAFLERVEADTGVASAHHRSVRAWWCALGAIVLALAGALAIIAARGGLAAS